MDKILQHFDFNKAIITPRLLQSVINWGHDVYLLIIMPKHNSTDIKLTVNSQHIEIQIHPYLVEWKMKRINVTDLFWGSELGRFWATGLHPLANKSETNSGKLNAKSWKLTEKDESRRILKILRNLWMKRATSKTCWSFSQALIFIAVED